MWRPAYVAIGSNLLDPRGQVQAAFGGLDRIDSTRLEARSRFYLTRPMGPQDQPDFVNAVAGLLTRLPVRALLGALLGLERAAGRNRQERWGPRILDLDLVWMAGAAVDDPDFKVPHPGVSERNFVLYPLCDVAPDLLIPGHGRARDLRERVGGAGISVLE